MLQQQESEFSFNKAALESIVNCLVCCGKQGIALRRHRDDSTANESANKGNFKALLFFFFLAKSVVTVCELIISPHFYTNNEDYEGCTDGWSWDSDTKTRAQGILASFRNFEFSVCIVALKNILMPLRGIISKLQKRDLDIYEAIL